MKYTRVNPLLSRNQDALSRNIAIANEINLELENRNIAIANDEKIQEIFEQQNRGIFDDCGFQDFVYTSTEEAEDYAVAREAK